MAGPDIQIAFQGGGAKFITMLPVAAAFQACERAGVINIKSLAGTSAGAICAALIAAECDFDQLRTYLISAGPAHVNKLMGDDYKKLRQVVDANWAERIPLLFSSASVLKSIFHKGTPILNELSSVFSLVIYLNSVNTGILILRLYVRSERSLYQLLLPICQNRRGYLILQILKIYSRLCVIHVPYQSRLDPFR